MKQLNLAFYTYFYGTDANPARIIPAAPSKHYKCFYITNNKSVIEELKTTLWIGVYHDLQSDDDEIESCMFGKFIKTCPHKFTLLSDYDYLCYTDTKYPQICEYFVENQIEKMFDDNCGLIIREHFFISGNVWDEFKVSMVHNRYRMQQQRYIDYINKQVSLGLKDTTPNHFLGGFLIRNMKHPQINKFNETWYSHILECGIQDQISLFFVKQLYPKFIKSFDAEPHH